MVFYGPFVTYQGSRRALAEARDVGERIDK